MKLAISGKGGTGKTTLAALLARFWAEQGKDIIAVDADPDANLAGALGLAGGSHRRAAGGRRYLRRL